jgi:hypothetical protein
LGDPEEELRYEVEIMLGTVDESHIIRTIEYWDIERRRFPTYEHRAVIVAEEITNRFFNVISLLNRAVPIIALQLSGFLVNNQLSLSFVKVLDVMEEGEEETGELVDRKFWEVRASKKSIELLDSIIALVPNGTGDLRVKYNRSHVALGSSGTNFCWLHPRKSGHIHFHTRTGETARQGLMAKLEERGIECGPNRSNDMKIVLTTKELEDNKELIAEVLTAAELNSRK